LSFFVAVLNNPLHSSVRYRCQSLRSLILSSLFYLISIGQLYAIRVPVWSGVAFKLAHCIESLKNLTASSMSSSVLRETFRVNLSLMRSLK
jgi:hypothetical protein